MWRFVLTVAFALFLARAVSAHAELLRSDPASGSVVANPPGQITLWFSEPIEAVADSVTVTSADGTRIDNGDAAASSGDPARLVASLDARAAGTYRVSWRAVSADGHPINGSFVFSVGRTDPSVLPSLTRDDERLAHVLEPIGRWLHLIAIVMLSGPMLMLLLVGADGGTLVDRLWRFARAGAVLGVPAALVMLISQAASTRGSLIEAFRVATLRDALGTHWGTLWIVRAVLVGALIGITHWRVQTHSSEGISRFSGIPLVMTALAGLVLGTALNGHAAATPPVVLSVAIDWVHLAATAAWTGGLITLSLCVLPWLKIAAPEQRRTLLRRVVLRFSTVALVAVELLILTGLYHTWAHVDGSEALATTPYGQALLSKIGLIVATMFPAAVNLLVMRPRLAVLETGVHYDAWSRRFGRVVAVEAVLAILIIAVAARLTSMPDARVASRESRAPAAVEATPRRTLAANAGSTHVTLEIGPGQVGLNRVHFSVHDAAGSADAPHLRVEAPPGAGLAAWTVTPAREADGYVATLDLAPAGLWTVHVLGIGQAAATFRIEIPFLAEQKAP